MQAITTHTGRAVPLRRSDVDTDQIIPSDWLKRVERTGFGAGLFSEWRDRPRLRARAAAVRRRQRPRHRGELRHGLLARARRLGAAGLRLRRRRQPPLRRHLPQQRAQGRARPRAAARREQVEALWAMVEADPSLRGDRRRRLPASCAPATSWRRFPLDDYSRWRLMEGLDDIGLTLRHEADIAAYEAARPSFLPTTARAGDERGARGPARRPAARRPPPGRDAGRVRRTRRPAWQGVSSR